MTPRIIVFISGNGSNLQAIIDAINSKTLEGQIVLVVSNKKSAYGLTRATQAGIPTFISIGINAIERAYKAFKDGEIKKTGVMIHKVIPAVDKGEPLLIEEVSILETDSLEDLEMRIHSVEHRLIVQAAKKFLNELNR